YIPTPLSIFEGIEALPVGQSLCIATEGQGSESIGSWREHDRFRGDQDDAVRQLRSLLTEIVQARLGSARDVGIFLSGGVDSSLIAALLVEAGATVHLFTLDFGAP